MTSRSLLSTIAEIKVNNLIKLLYIFENIKKQSITKYLR